MTDTEDPIKLAIGAASACSSLACLLALLELFYFKLHKQFSYRLISYILTALALSSLMTTLLPLILYGIPPEEITEYSNLSVAVKTLTYLHTSFYCTALTLVVTTTKHFHYMAVDFEYCKGLFTEFGCLLFSILLPQCFIWISYSSYLYSILPHLFNPWLVPNTSIMFCLPVLDPFLGIETMFIMSLAVILISIAVLWIMGKRACFHEDTPLLKHSQALKETLILISFFLIFTTHSVLLSLTTIAKTVQPGMRLVTLHAVVGIIGASIGLIGAVSFFLHLCVMGKKKRQKLRDLQRGTRKREQNIAVQERQQRVTYGSTVVVPSRWSVYTTEGYYTGSCNTDFPHVDEEDVDGREPHQ